MNKFNIKSESQKLEIVEYLRQLGTGKIKPDCEQFGICLNLSTKFDRMTDCLIADLSVGWDKHSGDQFYPIKIHELNIPSKPYSKIYSKEFWNGRQGDDRRELCLYIADKLETMELDY